MFFQVELPELRSSMASGIVSGGGTGGGPWRRGLLQEGGLNSLAMVAMAHKEAASGIFSISYSGDLQMMLNPWIKPPWISALQHVGPS